MIGVDFTVGHQRLTIQFSWKDKNRIDGCPSNGDNALDMVG